MLFEKIILLLLYELVQKIICIDVEKILRSCGIWNFVLIWCDNRMMRLYIWDDVW